MRLDHLLSKELLTTLLLPCMGWWWLSVLPIAQAFVLRWVLMGGISTNQSFLAWPCWLCPGVSTALLCPLVGVWWCWERAGAWLWGLCLAHCWVLRQQDLFAAMHGGTFWCFFCSCFCPFTAVVGPAFVCGLWWWGWLTGLLFENYIVDASIWNTHVVPAFGLVGVCSYSNFL